MCEPTTLALLSMASAGAGLVGQVSAAGAQADANQRQYDNAIQARSDNANQITLRRQQEGEAASQKTIENDSQARQAQATAMAMGGPSGLSVDALLGDMRRKQATYNQSVNENLDRTNFALDNQLTNVNRGTASDINSLKNPDMPDFLGAALRIGGTYTKSFGDPFASSGSGTRSDGSRPQRSS